MTRIPDADIERLKSEVSLVALIEAAGHVLKTQGKDLAMRCPLHEGDDTPSLVVTPARNVWHCFGCQQGGSVIDWVMASRRVSFRHAVELLAHESPALAAPLQRAVRSVASPFALPGDANQTAADAALLDQVIDHYHTTLLTHADGLAYLAARGLDHADLIAHFRLGVGNRTLGYQLPEKNRVQGAALRGALQRIGLLRASGHEHFNGSLIIPILAGAPDGTAPRIVGVYGRKLRDDLRPGTPRHLYLPGPHRGVFNHADWHGAEEIILTESLIDALTFWCAGYQNVTCAFGVSGFTEEIKTALVASGVKRVLIAYDRDEAGDSAAAKLAPILQLEGIAAFRVVFPKGMDANGYALKVGPAVHSLGLVLRQAEPMSEGAVRGVSVPVATSPASSAPPAANAPAPADSTPPIDATPVLPLAAAVDVVPEPATPEPATPEPAAPEPSSPVPTPLPDIPIEVGEHDVVLRLGPRRYRIRGLEKNLAFEVLRVNVLVSMPESASPMPGALHADTFDLYQAKARSAFAAQASVALGIEAAAIQRDLGQLLLQLESFQARQIDQATHPKAESAPALSPADEAAALALLRDPALLDRIATDIEAIGVVGEGANAQIGYLACVSRLLDRPLAILIQSTSAAGKSTLMDALLSL